MARRVDTRDVFKHPVHCFRCANVEFKVHRLAYRYDAALDGLCSVSSGSANAAKFCAQLRGSTAAGHPDCSFSTLEKCRLRVSATAH
jgi:hypothetical protein